MMTKINAGQEQVLLDKNSDTTRVGDPKKILIYGINFPPEPIGVGPYTGDLAAYLSKSGHKVEVVTAAPHYPRWSVPLGFKNTYSKEMSQGDRVLRCPLFLSSNMRGVRRLLAPLSFALTSAPVFIWRMMAMRPDTVLVVEPTLLVAPVALLFANILGARSVLHVQDLEVDAAFAMAHLKSGFLRRIAEKIEAIVLGRFDVIVTISNAMRRNILHKVDHQRVAVIRNWVDTRLIYPLTGDNNYRNELGIEDGTFVVHYSGNIGAKQALHFVLQAAEILSDDPRVAFIVAGEGPEKAQLQSQYAHLPNVHFLGLQPTNRLCEFLNLADLHVIPQAVGSADLVLPSKLGGMLASGKTVLVMADANTELGEFLSGFGILVPPGDAFSLAKAITQQRNKPWVSVVAQQGRLTEMDNVRNLEAFRHVLFSDSDDHDTATVFSVDRGQK